MFGLTIVTKRKWEEMNMLLQIQEETLRKASEFLDAIEIKLTQACKEAEQNGKNNS